MARSRTQKLIYIKKRKEGWENLKKTKTGEYEVNYKPRNTGGNVRT